MVHFCRYAYCVLGQLPTVTTSFPPTRPAHPRTAAHYSTSKLKASPSPLDHSPVFHTASSGFRTFGYHISVSHSLCPTAPVPNSTELTSSRSTPLSNSLQVPTPPPPVPPPTSLKVPTPPSPKPPRPPQQVPPKPPPRFPADLPSVHLEP